MDAVIRPEFERRNPTDGAAVADRDEECRVRVLVEWVSAAVKQECRVSVKWGHPIVVVAVETVWNLDEPPHVRAHIGVDALSRQHVTRGAAARTEGSPFQRGAYIVSRRPE